MSLLSIHIEIKTLLTFHIPRIFNPPHHIQLNQDAKNTQSYQFFELLIKRLLNLRHELYVMSDVETALKPKPLHLRYRNKMNKN